jgi:hypothetical protein
MDSLLDRRDFARNGAAPIDGFPPISEIVFEIEATLSVILALALAAGLALKISGAG